VIAPSENRVLRWPCPRAAAKVVPAIAQLFSSSDRAIRRSLLEGVDAFARHFSPELVEEKIFPAIATGAMLTRRSRRCQSVGLAECELVRQSLWSAEAGSGE
jgi:hypothetical protein